MFVYQISDGKRDVTVEYDGDQGFKVNHRGVVAEVSIEKNKIATINPRHPKAKVKDLGKGVAQVNLNGVYVKVRFKTSGVSIIDVQFKVFEGQVLTFDVT